MGPSVTDVQKGANTSTGFGNVALQHGFYETRKDRTSNHTAGGFDRPLRDKKTSRSRSPTERIVDIQTEEN